MVKQKSIVIIDGSNFYHKLKDLELGNLSIFDYKSWATSLTKNTLLKACKKSVLLKKEDLLPFL